ncbi:nitroreductase family protein [Marinobacterium rhizophilum]|uniref:Putative NAD(P)H nitroreductase n=1 Tax=Marinobacterium rhizophilum TaxID=420402 RepID=A0ABY5HKN3_9GAMM|nr:nitroreductase [Marinobacterium rhizophilum]UTW12431.1 nitroreductase [Marinobacterium rhizophilum]
MDALDALINRVSIPLLQAPGPNEEQLEQMFRAALRAPDHGGIHPWRFLVIEGEGLDRLGELFLASARAKDPDLAPERGEKLQKAPRRAPMVVVVIGVTREHPKVPQIEQLISAGCAANNIVTAAHAMGVGAMWRTGDPAYDPQVLQGLGLGEHESLVGYIYLGTPSRQRTTQALEPADFVARWDGA